MTAQEQDILQMLCADVRRLTEEVEALRRQLAPEGERWLTLKQFCAMTGQAESTVREHLPKGMYPWAVKHGKCWRFPERRVQMLIRNKT